MNSSKKSRYQNGKIYALRSFETDKIYIGSTCQPLSKCFSGYKSCFQQYKNRFSAFELFKKDDCYIELLENCPCNSKEELQRRQGELIREYKAKGVCINQVIPRRTEEERALTRKKKSFIKKEGKYYILENGEYIPY
jgi:hypothetical protein